MFLNKSYNPPSFQNMATGSNSSSFRRSMSQAFLEMQANRMHRNKELFNLMFNEMVKLAKKIKEAKSQRQKDKLSEQYDSIADQYSFQDGIDEDVDFKLI